MKTKRCSLTTPADVRAWCRLVHAGFGEYVRVSGQPPCCARNSLVRRFKKFHSDWNDDHINTIEIITRGGYIDDDLGIHYAEVEFKGTYPLAKALRSLIDEHS